MGGEGVGVGKTWRSERMSLAKGAPMGGSEAEGLVSPGVGGRWPPPKLVDLHLHPLHLCQELLLVRGS